MRRLNGTDFSYNLFITCEEKELNIRKNNESNRVRSPRGGRRESNSLNMRKNQLLLLIMGIYCADTALSPEILKQLASQFCSHQFIYDLSCKGKRMNMDV